MSLMPVVLGLLLWCSCVSAQVLNSNAGFESGLEDWIVYKGPGLETSAIVEVGSSNSCFNSKHVFMRLPAGATDNQTQYVKLGQVLMLSKSRRYRYSVDVKWANPENNLKSAIVSIWVKDEDKTYNGKDVWLKDDRKQTLSFEFSPNRDGRTDCYISLLTHQDGFEITDILFDNLIIEDVGDAVVDQDPRGEDELIANGGFENGYENWQKSERNPHQVNGLVRTLDGTGKNTVLQMELPAAADTTLLNGTSIGVLQWVKLYAGNTYVLSAEIDRTIPRGTEYPTIVNLFAYRPEGEGYEKAWLGSVDYKFNKSEKHVYSQEFTPSVTTDYQITVRVFGWGNDGRPLNVRIDNISLRKTLN